MSQPTSDGRDLFSHAEPTGPAEAHDGLQPQDDEPMPPMDGSGPQEYDEDEA